MITHTLNEDTSGFKKKFRNARKTQEVASFDDDDNKVEIKIEPQKIEKKEKIVEEKKVSLFSQLIDEED